MMQHSHLVSMLYLYFWVQIIHLQLISLSVYVSDQFYSSAFNKSDVSGEHVEPNELNKDVFKHVEQPWTFRDIT